MIWISAEDVILIHSRVIEGSGGLDGLRDRDGLEAAVSAPMQTFDGIQIFLPTKQIVEVVRHIRALLWSQKTDLQNVADDLFQRLPVFLIHGQKEEREHDENHADRRRAGANASFEQKEKRYAYQRAASETQQLSFCQIEHDLGFHRVQVLGYRNVCQISSPPSVGIEQTL